MSCPILTPDRWQRLLESRLTAGESIELLEHLASDCPACEQFFESMDDEMEARMRLLLQTADPTQPASVSAESREAFRAVMRGVNEVRAARSAAPWRRWIGSFPSRPSAVLAGGVAVVVLAISVFLYLRQPLQTEKGAAPAAASIHLEFAVGARQPQGRVVVNRGVLGERYSAASSVFLRFDVPARSYVYVVGYREIGDMRLLVPGPVDQKEPYAAGAHDVRPNGQGGGIPLSGIQGRYVIVSVASAAPLNPDAQLMPIIRQAVDPVTGRVDQAWVARFGGGIAIDAVYFDVQA